MSMCGGGSKDAQIARADEAARQERIKQGTAAIDRAFAQYDDKFYDQRAQDYFNAAVPELNRQQARTKNDLVYNLAGKGQLRSSARDRLDQSLQTEIDKQRRIIGDAGLSQANALRASVEDARGRVYNQLLASGDPAQATAAATRASADIAVPSPVGAIGNVFSDWSQIYLTKQAAQQGDTSGLLNWAGNTGRSSRIIK